MNEFKLIAFAAMIYVLLDHFGGLKMVEKSLKNSGNMIILMGKVSLIIVLLIVFNYLVKRFKVIEGMEDDEEINTRQEVIERIQTMINEGKSLVEISEYFKKNEEMIRIMEVYDPIDKCHEDIIQFVKKDENSNITINEIIGILQCIKLRLVSGLICKSNSDDLTCIEYTIMENTDILKKLGNDKKDIFDTINQELDNDPKSNVMCQTSKNIDRLLLLLKYSEQTSKNLENAISLIEKIIHDNRGNDNNVLLDNELKAMELILQVFKNK